MPHILEVSWHCAILASKLTNILSVYLYRPYILPPFLSALNSLLLLIAPSVADRGSIDS